MRILIHTQYYPPEIGAPQARLSELASGLKARGFNVQVLTAMPSYPKGKIFPGYHRIRKKEIIDGILVVRTWLFPTQSTALLPRLANYFSFVFSSLLLGVWGLGKLDYVITESPPLFLGIAGFLISRLNRAKWIFNVSDLWPESAVHLGAIKPGLALALSEKIEAFFYRKAWLVTGQSKEIIANIEDRFPETNTYHLSNGVDIDQFSPSIPEPDIKNHFAPNGEWILFYGGLHGLAQGLDQLLYAAVSLNNNVKLVFVGDGPEKQRLKALTKDLSIQNVSFYDPIPMLIMPKYLACADIVFIPLKIELPGAVPSKLYEAMAAAKPVILIAKGEAASIVYAAECGLVVKPGDIRGITKAVQHLMSHPDLRDRMGKNGRIAVLQKYDRKTITANFSDYLNVCHRRPDEV